MHRTGFITPNTHKIGLCTSASQCHLATIGSFRCEAQLMLAGDSDDGIVTRSVMYLFEQVAKRPAGSCIAVKCAPGDLH